MKVAFISRIWKRDKWNEIKKLIQQISFILLFLYKKRKSITTALNYFYVFFLVQYQIINFYRIKTTCYWYESVRSLLSGKLLDLWIFQFDSYWDLNVANAHLLKIFNKYWFILRQQDLKNRTWLIAYSIFCQHLSWNVKFST